MVEERLIASIEKSPSQQLQVRLTNFRGRDYLDIRTFYLDEDEEWKPTKKGVAIPVDLYGELIEALEKAGKILQEEGSQR